MIVSLFDESGNALRPWAINGHKCLAFDILNDKTIETFSGGGSIKYIKADLSFYLRVLDLVQYYTEGDVDFIMGWPPCTDLAVSGAAHFKRKLGDDPRCQIKAVNMAKSVEFVANILNVPYLVENPVSVLASMWRKPDHYFHPYEYGGYLPLNDIHPRWPDYIMARDAYPKKTCIWSGGGFIMPEKKPVTVNDGYSIQHNKLGGKSKKTKQIRSEGPRGFLNAVYQFNS